MFSCSFFVYIVQFKLRASWRTSCQIRFLLRYCVIIIIIMKLTSTAVLQLSACRQEMWLDNNKKETMETWIFCHCLQWLVGNILYICCRILPDSTRFTRNAPQYSFLFSHFLELIIFLYMSESVFFFLDI